MYIGSQRFEIDMRAITRHGHKRHAGIFQLAQACANCRRQRGMIDWPINVKRRRQRVDQHWREIDIVARAVLALACIDEHVDEWRGRARAHAGEDADYPWM